MVRETKAYPRGNDGLWALRELDNIDKHRLLIAVGTRHPSVGIDFSGFFDDSTFPEIHIPLDSLSEIPGEIEPLEAGDLLYTVPAGTKHYTDPQFEFEIALAEPEILKGEPLLPTLVQLRDLVAGIIESFTPLFL